MRRFGRVRSGFSRRFGAGRRRWLSPSRCGARGSRGWSIGSWGRWGCTTGLCPIGWCFSSGGGCTRRRAGRSGGGRRAMRGLRGSWRFGGRFGPLVLRAGWGRGARSVRAARSVGSVGPAGSVKVARSARAAESVRSVGTARSVRSAGSVGTARSVGSVGSVGTAEPAEPAGSVRLVKPERGGRGWGGGQEGELLPALLSWMKGAGGVASPRPDVAFVEQGMDSVKLAALASEIEARLGTEVPVERFYAATPAELAAALVRDGLPEVGRADVVADLPLDGGIVPRSDDGSAIARWPVLLVTGVTGFLGAFLLAELLAQTEVDLICLVRAPDPEAGRERIRANLARYGLWDDGCGARIRVQIGDLAAPDLGLSAARWARLASQITGVYHCGAHVHWGLPYDRLKAANVEGTTALARLACEAQGAPFHFVSSLGVFPLGISPRTRFEEDDALLDGENLDLGYFQTKWVAERRLQQARARGLPVTVYRPGFIGGQRTTGRTSGEAQLFTSFLAGCLRLAAAPRCGQGDGHRRRRRRGAGHRRPLAARRGAGVQPAPSRAAATTGAVRSPARARATRSRPRPTPGGDRACSICPPTIPTRSRRSSTSTGCRRPPACGGSRCCCGRRSPSRPRPRTPPSTRSARRLRPSTPASSMSTSTRWWRRGTRRRRRRRKGARLRGRPLPSWTTRSSSAPCGRCTIRRPASSGAPPTASTGRRRPRRAIPSGCPRMRSRCTGRTCTAR